MYSRFVDSWFWKEEENSVRIQGDEYKLASIFSFLHIQVYLL